MLMNLLFLLIAATLTFTTAVNESSYVVFGMKPLLCIHYTFGLNIFGTADKMDEKCLYDYASINARAIGRNNFGILRKFPLAACQLKFGFMIDYDEKNAEDRNIFHTIANRFVTVGSFASIDEGNLPYLKPNEYFVPSKVLFKALKEESFRRIPVDVFKYMQSFPQPFNTKFKEMMTDEQLQAIENNVFLRKKLHLGPKINIVPRFFLMKIRKYLSVSNYVNFLLANQYFNINFWGTSKEYRNEFVKMHFQLSMRFTSVSPAKVAEVFETFQLSQIELIQEQIPNLDLFNFTTARSYYLMNFPSQLAAYGHLNLLKKYLSKVNQACHIEGSLPTSGNEETLMHLIKLHETNAETVPHSLQNSFEYSAKVGFLNVFKYCLERRGNGDGKVRLTTEILKDVVQNGHAEIESFLLGLPENKLEQDEVELLHSSNLYELPLIEAVKRGYSDVIKVLIEEGRVLTRKQLLMAYEISKKFYCFDLQGIILHALVSD